MTEYTVHFQKGWRVGARSLLMERCEAATPEAAIRYAKKTLFPTHKTEGYRVTRVDHFEGLRIVIDR
jgi:hypothetical protein